MDIVGPLPVDQEYRYCVTMIDPFCRWPEAVPIKNIEAITVARAFVDAWISRFGTPQTVTTDQGTQFESRLFSSLLQLSGCYRVRSSAYHPASNGMVERWHRTLKASIMCHSNSSWTRVLSTVLLGLRTAVMDCGASPAEFVYGKVLRIPGEFVLPENLVSEPCSFLSEFRNHMREVKPVPVTHHHKRRIFVYKDMSNCSHVFVRIVRALKKPLQCPYVGPYRIINRTISLKPLKKIGSKNSIIPSRSDEPVDICKQSKIIVDLENNFSQHSKVLNHVEPPVVKPTPVIFSKPKKFVPNILRRKKVSFNL
ncbi:uncharacterized protein K02A2.6-like [Leptopilina boulardi]|uniref:uncharacterized protein K02A2.6-like n=1 Tax=Leptopilina boulardi TaxID=63433 RepID=UPI0021F658B5|nr:uncharacterized protein K02A2.6-like [Leptopilina boulardi]